MSQLESTGARWDPRVLVETVSLDYRCIGKAVMEIHKTPKVISKWLVMGCTILIPKDGCKGELHQYRPITCLNIMYKFLTAIITDVLYKHALQAGVIPHEQRALVRGKRGCTDQCLADRRNDNRGG